MTTLDSLLLAAPRAGVLALALASACSDSDVSATTTPETLEADADVRYGVGTRAYEWTDPDRAEELTSEEGDARTLVVRAWYPANVPPSERAPYYLNPLQAQLNAQLLGVPAAAFESLELPAAVEAPVAEGRFPVLIFSPGMSTLPEYYGYQLADLASHGYVILALSHPYATGLVVFSDGRVAPEMPETPEGEGRDRSIDTWSLDQRFVLSQLERIDAAGAAPLAGHLDLERVGVFGHSRGGAAAAQSCLLDARYRACANLDGSVSTRLETHWPTQPFLLLRSELEEPRLDGFFAHLPGPAYRVAISGAGHNSFTDLPRLIERWRQHGWALDAGDLLLGTLAAERAFEISGAYLDAFFSAELSGAAVPLLSVSSPYPEVTMTAASQP